MAAAAVVGRLDPGDDREAELSRVAQRRRLRTFFCSRLKNDSIAALSAQAPTRPIDPCSWCAAGLADEGVGAELAAAVGVDHGAGRAAQRDGVAQGVTARSAVIRVDHGVADDPVGAGVLDRAQVELALARWGAR